MPRKGVCSFTTDPDEAVKHGLFQFIAVGTPPDEDGSADLQYVLAVAQTIAEHMDDYRVVVDKSTVPVGTADRVREKIKRAPCSSWTSSWSSMWYPIRSSSRRAPRWMIS